MGVVKTGKYRSLAEDPLPFLYRPFTSSAMGYLVVRCGAGEQTVLDEVQREIRRLDPNVVPIEMESVTAYMTLPLFAAHTTGLLLAVFGGAALLLATIGLSALMSCSVNQRASEIGVRMALGAGRGNVLRMVIGQGMRLTAIGIVCGLAIAFAVTRLLAGLLYGIKPSDPLTYLAISVFLAAVALVSCYVPARRAASTDPMTALRRE